MNISPIVPNSHVHLERHAQVADAVGVGPQGAVHASRDGGESWQESGSLPEPPHAFEGPLAVFEEALQHIGNARQAGRLCARDRDRANEPAERLAMLTTFVFDPTNPELGYSIADRAEAGFELVPT